MYVPDSRLVQDDDEVDPSGRSSSFGAAENMMRDDEIPPIQTSHVVIATTKVCYLFLLIEF